MSRSPRTVYLILAHENESQLAALVARLLPPGSSDRAFIHIDRKSQLWRQTRGRFLAGNPQVTVLDRPLAVRWGHASQVAAIRLLLRAALQEPFGLAHLISGADWPVHPVPAMPMADPVPCYIEARPGVQSDRMERVRLDTRLLRPDPDTWWQWYPARAMRRLSGLIPARKARPWGPWHKGSQWWSLPADVCHVVLAELDRAFRIGQLFGSQCADEHLVQTIVAHRFPERIAPNHRFLRWTEGKSSPEVLRAGDWAAAQDSGAWFARKVSSHVDDFFLTPTD